MTKRVSVIWSAVLHPDSDHVIYSREETLLPAWADSGSNAQVAAQTVFESALDCERWEQEFVHEWGPEEVAVLIHEPPSIAGCYLVHVELRPQATASRLTDAQRLRLVDMLENEPVEVPA